MEKKVALFLVDGFEEMEALAPIDLMRRAGIIVDTVSIKDNKNIVSSRNIQIISDKQIDEINFEDYNMIVLPGGPGTKNYYNSQLLLENIVEFSKSKKLGAICAAPTVFSSLGILKNKKAVCFPACEEDLIKGEAILVNEKVVTDGNITTSKAAGTSIDFALEIIKVLIDENISKKIKNEICY